MRGDFAVGDTEAWLFCRDFDLDTLLWDATLLLDATLFWLLDRRLVGLSSVLRCVFRLWDDFGVLRVLDFRFDAAPLFGVAFWHGSR